ncbi:MAG: two-component system response regulator [Gammaproteobacteria bacterium]|nr:two-component system response regulator [Gammaproteobacteria bacterium]
MPKATILVVDDTPGNIDVLHGILRGDYLVRAATTGEKALALAKAQPHPDLILLDVMMPGMDGYEVGRRLKADFETGGIPVIFVTAMNEIENEARGFELGAVDYITKPVNPAIVRARVRAQLALYNQKRHLAELVRQRTRELEETRLQIIRRLGRAAEFTDDDTGYHVIRMSHYARLLALADGWPEYRADLLFSAAPMHDVGKIGIPDQILQKPGPLTPEEWAIVRRHPAIGAGIIGRHGNELLEMARVIALTHHEKWDGSGYPRGLSGERIPPVGRVVAIADVFDALTSQRPYKPAWPVEEAVDYLKRESGRHFDPQLVPKFLQLLPQVRTIMAEYAQIGGWRPAEEADQEAAESALSISPAPRHSSAV